MNTSARMRDERTVRRQTALRRKMLPVLLAGCFGTVAANPLGPQVVNGQASFISQGNVLSVTNTPGAIINWQSFSINPGEVTRFIQQNPNSAVLNRIVGQDPSQILGALHSNGRVFLINPNGILFGQGAQVDVNGLVASTLNISNDDFLKGKLDFKAGDKAAGVKNQGTITTPAGGQVYLIAPNVENAGIITSPRGEVLLAAGHTVQLVDSMNPDLHVVLSAPEHEALNLGKIIAQGGKTGIYGALVKQRGIVNANSAVVGENGKIVLKASRDALLEAGSETTATGAGKGGEIHVLGDRVGLMDNARIDASGKQGGGTVLVGGDFQGNNPAIMNARRTYVGKDAKISADAIDQGDGGRVIVWSDEATRAYGTISARGGQQGGDGGFAEVSGKEYLDFRATTDLGAPAGKTGTLLLDPYDIVIQDNSGADSVDVTQSPVNTFNAGAVTSIIDNTLLGTRLNAPANIVVKTTSGSITVADPVAWTSSSTLTLDASSNIDVANTLTGSAGSVVLKAGNAITQSAAITASSLSATATGGAVTLDGASNAIGSLSGSASTTFDFKNGATDLTVTALSAGGNANITSGAKLSVSGWDSWTGVSRTLKAAGDLALNASVNGGVGSSLILESTSGNISQTQALTLTSVNATTDAGQVSLTHASNNVGTISGAAASNFGFATTGALTVGATGIEAGTSVLLTAGGNLALQGAVNGTTGSTAVSLRSTGGNINQSGAGTISAASLIAYADTGDVTLTGAGNAVAKLAGYAGGGSGFAFKNTPGLSVGVLAASNLNVTAARGVEAANQAISIEAGGNLDINMSTMIDTNVNGYGIKAGTGDIVLSATGAITQPGTSSLVSGNSAVFSAGGGIYGASSNAPLKTSVNALQAVNTGSGTMYFDNALDLEIKDISSVGYGISQSSSTQAVKVTTAADKLLKVSGRISAPYGSISLGADKLDIAADVDAGSSGKVEIVPVASGRLIDVASTVTGDSSLTRLELSKGELNRITAGMLTIGNTSSGNLSILNPLKTGAGEALAGVSNALSLKSGGAIMQAANATIEGGASVQATGTSVTLTEDNYIGVIAGVANAGDFKYRSINSIMVKSVAGVNGITATGNNVYLDSDDTVYGIEQLQPIVATGLALKSKGPVTLDHASNSVSKLAANLSVVGAGTGGLQFDNAGSLAVDTVLGISGITTNNQEVVITAATGTLTTSQSISAGTNRVVLGAPTLVVNSSVTANDVELEADSLTLDTSASITSTIAGIHPITPGRTIMVGDTCTGCLSVTNLSKINAATIGIGDSEAPLPGKITVAGITAPGASATTDRHANTLRIGLMSGSDVVQTGAIDVRDLGVMSGGNVNLATSNNHVENLAGSTAGGSFAFTNDQSFKVAYLADSGQTYAYSVSGLSTNNGNVTLTLAGAAAAELGIPTQINAGTGTVTLDSTGSVYGSGSSPDIIASVVSIRARGASSTSGIGAIDGANGLHINASRISSLVADNGDIDVLGFTGLTLGPAAVGTTAVTAVSAPLGAVTIRTNMPYPITVNGDISANGDISLISGAAASSHTGNVLTINRSITSATGNITLAGHSVTGTSVPTGANVILQVASTTGTGSGTGSGTGTGSDTGSGSTPPTLDQCVADPSLSGCTSVLPTLSSCTSNPTQAGCSAVLPTLSSCTTNPTQAGCSAVLPTLSSCTTNPTQAGCSAVLPTLSSCTTNPTQAGCSAVLPTLGRCTTNPAQAGCSAVLPTLSSCTTNPAQAGCSAVLPTLSSCTANPAQDGCATVLPTLNSCVSNPALPGCTVVLPSVGSCTANPALSGCTAVLPTLSSCTSNPSQAGCSAVLPNLSACTATPTLAGCSVVLPTLAQCAANPNQEGCSVVIPIASRCTLNPSLPECGPVLPGTPPADPTTPASDTAQSNVSRLLSSSINTVVTSTASTQASATTGQTGDGAAPGGSTGTARQTSKPANSSSKSPSSEKSEDSKDEKKTTSGPEDSGTKKNEPARKLYCN